MAQEQFGASSLEAIWLPALADGLRAGGHADIADRVWPPDRSSDITVRMAYYGDLFLAAGTMGEPTARAGDRARGCSGGDVRGRVSAAGGPAGESGSAARRQATVLPTSVVPHTHRPFRAGSHPGGAA